MLIQFQWRRKSSVSMYSAKIAMFLEWELQREWEKAMINHWSNFGVTRNFIRRTTCPIDPRLREVENQVERTSLRAATLSSFLSSSRHIHTSFFFSRLTGVKGASSGTRFWHSWFRSKGTRDKVSNLKFLPRHSPLRRCGDHSRAFSLAAAHEWRFASKMSLSPSCVVSRF